jgi:hypothetical protein
MSTIKQKSITVTLVDGPRVGLADDHKIAVRRMSWNSFRDFLHTFGKYFGDFVVHASSGDLGKRLHALPCMILGVKELVEKLIPGSTDLTLEQVGALDPVDLFELVTAACKIHGGDDLKNSFAGVKAATIDLALTTGLIRKKTTTSDGEKYMPFWSTPDTPPTTSTVAPSGTST